MQNPRRLGDAFQRNELEVICVHHPSSETVFLPEGLGSDTFHVLVRQKPGAMTVSGLGGRSGGAYLGEPLNALGELVASFDRLMFPGWFR
jgi:hypothetical protein